MRFDAHWGIWLNYQILFNAMERKTQAKYQARAAILKALAHPSRLFIVEELAKGERCVCELQRMIGADMSTVSKHLSLLKAAGLVSDEKRGNMVFYSLLCPCVLNFLDCTETVLRQNAEKQLETVT
jgi:DNA-binding transcriptional ArsR family regulator